MEEAAGGGGGGEGQMKMAELLPLEVYSFTNNVQVHIQGNYRK